MSESVTESQMGSVMRTTNAIFTRVIIISNISYRALTMHRAPLNVYTHYFI